jgi:YVTN family beta-propeller protein
VRTATFTLTHREREVAELVAHGLTNRQIAAKLFIAERTAEYHVEQIRNKLGFHARSQIAAWVAADLSGPASNHVGPVSLPAADAAPRWRAQPWAWLAVLGLVAAVVATAAGLGAASLFRRPPAPAAASPGRVIQLSVATGQLTRWSGAIPARTNALAVGAGAIWTVSYGNRVLIRINPTSAAVSGSYGTAAPPVGIAIGGGLVWIATAFGDHALEPFDPKTNQFDQPVALGSDVAVQGIAFGWNSIWVTDKNNNLVYRVNPSTNMVTTRITVGDGPEGIAVDSTGVWVANGVDATVSRLDPNSARVVATIGLPAPPTAIATGPSGVWVVCGAANLVVRIDPATNAHLEIPIDAHPSGVAVTRVGVWVVDGVGGRLIRIDSSNGRVTSSMSVGGTIDAISTDDQSVWVTVSGGA